MGYTRRDFVNGACEELGVSTYTFDLPPERLEEMGRRLDTMMATWNARGIRLGYPLPSAPGSNDLDEATGVPDMAYEAVTASLALKCAPIFGKTPSPDTRASAKSAMNALLIHFSGQLERQLGRIPAGAGNKPWRWGDPFLPPPADPLEAGPDGPLEFN